MIKNLITFTILALAACAFSCKKDSPLQKAPAKANAKATNTCTAPPQIIAMRTVGGPSADGGSSIFFHSQGILAVAGAFIGTVDFDPGPSVKNLVGDDQKNTPAFTMYFDRTGKFLNAVKENSSAQPGTASRDKQGNRYVILSQNTLGGPFDNGCGDFRKNYLLAKLSPDLKIIWTRYITKNVDSWCYVSAYQKMDANENVIINLEGKWHKFSPTGEHTEFMLTPNPGTGVFWVDKQENIYMRYPDKKISKYNVHNGKLAGQFTRDISFNDIDFDIEGNIYTTGIFAGTRDFDPGAGVFPITASTGSAAYIRKLDPAGRFIWAKQLGDSHPNAIKVEPNSNNIYITGYFLGTQVYQTTSGPVTATSKGDADTFIIALHQCN